MIKISILVNDSSSIMRESNKITIKNSHNTSSIKNDRSLLHNLSVSMSRSEDVKKKRHLIEKEREKTALDSLMRKNKQIISKLKEKSK